MAWEHINSTIKKTSSYDVNIEISEDIYQELSDCQCVDGKTTTMNGGVRCTHMIKEGVSLYGTIKMSRM